MSSAAAAAAMPASHPGGVLLLKARNTKAAGADPYELAFTGAGYVARFLPPISFSQDAAAVADLESLLRTGRRASGIAGIVATSPRGLDALRAALRAACAQDHDAAVARMRDLWSTTPVFVVAAASAAALHSTDAATGGDLPRRCGFEACVVPGVTNGIGLGNHIRTRWEELRQETARQDSEQPTPRMLVLVGNRRRDELQNILAGRQPDGSAHPQPPAAIPVQELMVYHTHLAEGADAASTGDNAEASSFLRGLASNLDDMAAALPASAPIYVAFFSPTGVQSFFAQLAHLQPADSNGGSQHALAKQILAAHGARMRYACIGLTSAQAVLTLHASTGVAVSVSPLLLASEPSAESLLDCIVNDKATRPSTPPIPPSWAPSALVGPSVPAHPHLHSFYKYHGTLNDYVLLDGFERHYTRAQLATLARVTGEDRRGAIGSDGLLYVTMGRERTLGSSPECLSPVEADPEKSHVLGRMYMFNTDGSEAEMCGNGLRCVAKFVYDHKFSSPRPSILHMLTGAGDKIARITPDPATGLAASIALDLGRPALSEDLTLLRGSSPDWALEAHDVSMGNPHCIVVVPPPDAGIDSANSVLGYPLESVDVPVWGKRVHDDEHYAPARTNVSFVMVRSESHPAADAAAGASSTPAAAAAAAAVSPFVLTLDIRTYERGNGETWSCGSGISASVSSVLSRRHRSVMPATAQVSPIAEYKETVRVFVRGGELRVTCTLRDRPVPALSPARPRAPLLLRDVLRVELDGPATEVFQGTFPFRLQDA